MNDSQLEQMSMRELREFRDAVDAAIRASIARDRNERSAKILGPAVEQRVVFDLERERDAWRASRK